MSLHFPVLKALECGENDEELELLLLLLNMKLVEHH